MWQFFHKKCGFTKSKIQRFSCKDCYKKFTLKKKNKSQKLYNSYITEKKILNTLAKENKKSLSTIYNAFKLIKIAKPVKLENIKEVILLVDALNFGVVVFKDAISKKFIWWHFIERKEILAVYKLGFEWCLNNGYIIKAVVADGLKGLAKTFTPFQNTKNHPNKAY